MWMGWLTKALSEVTHSSAVQTHHRLSILGTRFPVWFYIRCSSLRERDHLPSSESSTLQGNFLRTWRDRRSLHHSPLGGVSLMLLHCRQWPSLSFAWRESSCFVRIFLTAVMCLNEIFNFLQQRDAPRKEIVDFSSHGSHFRSGINFLYAGTIASIHKDEWRYFFSFLCHHLTELSRI